MKKMKGAWETYTGQDKNDLSIMMYKRENKKYI